MNCRTAGKVPIVYEPSLSASLPRYKYLVPYPIFIIIVGDNSPRRKIWFERCNCQLYSV